MKVLLLLALLALTACQEEPGAAPGEARISLRAPPTAEGLRLALEQAAPALLREQRPKASLEGVEVRVLEEDEAFQCQVLLRYSNFLHPKARALELRFLIRPSGEVSGCRLRDPLPTAAEVSCQRLEAKIAKAL
jgi:hypothetical protein